MEGAGQTGGAGANDQDVGFELFALCGHRFFSLAERANGAGCAAICSTETSRRAGAQLARPYEMSDTPLPRVFCEKRLQAAENKGNECEKERQERARMREPLTAGELHGLGVRAERHT
jgi:hypothetical protein